MKSLLLSLTIIFSFFFSIFNYSYSSSDTLKYFTGEVFVVSAPQSGNVRFSDKRIQLSKIENRDFTSTSELLNAVNAGITFKNSRNETVVSMRGFDRKQVAFFFDGVPLNAPNDGFTDIDIIPSSALALVSISKASTSNTYGVNTMGGAVNFISDEIAEPLKLDVKLMHGTTSYAEMLAGGSMNKFYWLLSADYSTSDGFSPADYKSDINISEKASENRLNSEFDKHSYFLKTGYNFSNSSSLGVSYLKSDGSRNVPINVYSNRKRFWQFTDISNEIASLSFNSNLTEKFSIRTNAFYSSMYNKLGAFDDSTYSTQTARSSFNSVFDDYSAGVSINGSYFISNDLTSNLYTSYKKDNHSSQSNTGAEFKDYSSSYFSVGLDNRYSFNKTAFYFSAAYDLLTPLSADTITSAGNLRENADAINFSIGSEYSEDLGILYASFSGKTRFPTLKELYSEFMGRNEPNPTLKPERVLTGEIGIRAVDLLGIDLSASIFVSQLKDLIQYFPSSDGLRKFDNVGEAIFTGT